MAGKHKLRSSEREAVKDQKTRQGEKVWFVNRGGPYRHSDGSIKIPGKKFKAYPEDVSESMRVHIVPLDGSEDQKEEPLPTPKTKSGYDIAQKSPGWYNVIQKETGKIVNEIGLRKAEAEALINSLEG